GARSSPPAFNRPARRLFVGTKPYGHRRSAALTTLGVLALALCAAALLRPKGAVAADTAVVIDGADKGRTFDGIGAVSGGGGNSRLLIDYPEPQRGQILDHLFKPGYGAPMHSTKGGCG